MAYENLIFYYFYFLFYLDIMLRDVHGSYNET